ncbi:MAG: Fe-S cluster assembly sulfur transfer protein SufU [Pseudomonadota bacterium]
MELADLYKDLIIDHNKSPRNFGRLEPASHTADGFNALCGDKLTIYLNVDDDERISDVRFEGAGCAISIASASLMTEHLKGLRLAQAKQVFGAMHALLTDTDADVDQAALGKLAALSGVRAYPSRVKCATLCWHTVNSALSTEDPTTVSTE